MTEEAMMNRLICRIRSDGAFHDFKMISQNIGSVVPTFSQVLSWQ
jgi:hypothetical protein